MVYCQTLETITTQSWCFQWSCRWASSCMV